MNAQTDFRDILKRELAQRMEANPRYSLRAFARDLNVSASTLSEVMNGHHGLSRKGALEIAERLNLSQKETALFCDLVEAKHGKGKLKKEQAEVRLKQFESDAGSFLLQMDALQVLSDWHHYAILELTHIEKFESDPKWISQALNIPVMTVELALKRLIRLRLLSDENGVIKATEGFTASPSDVPSEALKKFHKQVLAKASEAVVLQSIDNRDFSSMILSFNKEQLEEARKEIESFRRSFDKKFDVLNGQDSVYALAIQFFELTK